MVVQKHTQLVGALTVVAGKKMSIDFFFWGMGTQMFGSYSHGRFYQFDRIPATKSDTLLSALALAMVRSISSSFSRCFGFPCCTPTCQRETYPSPEIKGETMEPLQQLCQYHGNSNNYMFSIFVWILLLLLITNLRYLAEKHREAENYIPCPLSN